MNHYNTVLAVDPGATGGIACWRAGEPIQAFAMPETEGDQIELIRELINEGEAIAFVEKVGGFTGKGQPGSAMFKFGKNYGFILGVLQTLGVRVELVLPHAWQKPLGLGTASVCSTRSEWKNKLKSCAQRLYPKLKATLLTSDAILINSRLRAQVPESRKAKPMNESIAQIEGKRGQALDVERLIEAVRGSRVARILFELRRWLPRTVDQIGGGTASDFAVPPSP